MGFLFIDNEGFLKEESFGLYIYIYIHTHICQMCVIKVEKGFVLEFWKDHGAFTSKKQSILDHQNVTLSTLQVCILTSKNILHRYPLHYETFTYLQQSSYEIIS